MFYRPNNQQFKFLLFHYLLSEVDKSKCLLCFVYNVCFMFLKPKLASLNAIMIIENI